MASSVFERVLRFFGTIATALTGAGAVCTAAGFLAERTRWSMLGFGAVPSDLNEYLFTGARFLAFLPGIAITSVLTAAASSVTAFFLAIAGVIALALLRWRRARRRALTAAGKAAPESAWPGWLRPWGLGALAVAQFAATMVLFRAGRLRNVLFADLDALGPAECGRDGLSLQAEVMLGCEAELTEHMGHVILIVALSAGALWLLVRGALHRTDGERMPKALLAVNAALLTVQVILLPINYGALFLRNEFALVEVTPAAPEPRAERWPVDNLFALLHRRDDEFYLYARSARRIWLVPRDDVRTLTYLGICGVFDPPGRCHPESPSLPIHPELP